MAVNGFIMHVLGDYVVFCWVGYVRVMYEMEICCVMSNAMLWTSTSPVKPHNESVDILLNACVMTLRCRVRRTEGHEEAESANEVG